LGSYDMRWFAILLAISFIAIPVHALEIRGQVAGTLNGASNLVDNSFAWNPQNFGGFFYDLKKILALRH